MPAKLPTEPFPRRINIAGLEKRLACSRTTIQRRYSTGDFPKPHHLGQNRVWWEAEIVEWETRRALAPPPALPGRPKKALRATTG